MARALALLQPFFDFGFIEPDGATEAVADLDRAPEFPGAREAHHAFGMNANPHSIRNTLTQLAYDLKLHPMQMKAWSQNMGHDSPLTTINSYGHLTIEQQAEIIGSICREPLGTNPDRDIADRIAEKVAAMLRGHSACSTTTMRIGR